MQRIGGSRVKSGCQSCKKRHLKCDEARPQCQKCFKAGYICTYDTAVSAGSTQSKSLRVIQYTPLQANRSSLTNLTPSEIRGAEFYQLQTADELNGFFSSRLWSTVIPQIANSESAVRFALLAVSALHESFRSSRQNDTNKSEVAMQHYSRAIHHVVNFDSSQSCNLDTVLASCILFTLIEILRSRYGAALTHVSSGLKLLSTQAGANDHRAGDNVSVSLFRDAFLWFDTQAIEIGDKSYHPYSTPHIDEPLPHCPQEFSCIQDAYQIFNAFFNRFTRTWQWIDASEQITSTSITPDPASIFDNYRILNLYFRRWSEAFSRSRFCDSEPGVLVLRINRIIMNILFNTIRFGMAETAWDNETPQFQRAVELAEQLTGIPPVTARPPTITTSMGIVTSLYLVTTRCRHPQIRRRALHLLKALNCREGMWDSTAAANIAEQIIKVEEAGAVSISSGMLTTVTESRQIPESTRVRDLEVRFGDGSDASVNFNMAQGQGEAAIGLRDGP